MKNTCNKCGNKIKKNYNVCPNCGTKVVTSDNEQLQDNSKNVVHIAIFVTCTVILIIYFCNNGFENLFNIIKNTPDYNTQKIYNLGETLHCPNFDVIVNDFKIKKKGYKIDNFTAISDPEWIGVIVSVKNISNEDNTFYTSNISLTNTNGEILSYSLLTFKIWGVELFDSPKLVSGGTKKGYVQFSNNQTDNSNLILNVKCQTELFKDEIIYKVKLSK